jgi:glycerol-1-phosphate dehydrogenase [NAD(P)+]
MAVPQIFIAVDDIYRELEEYLDKLQVGKNIAIISGPTKTREIARDIKRHVEKYNLFEPIVVENITAYTELNIEKEILKEGATAIIGLGGGKAIDMAKYVGNSIHKPVISIPTQITHDGVANNVVTIKQFRQHFSKPVDPPIALILLMPILYESPLDATKKGIADVMAKVATANPDWKLSSEYSCDEKLCFMNRRDPPYIYNTRISISSSKAAMEVINLLREMRNSKKPFSKENPLFPNFFKKFVDAVVTVSLDMNKLRSTVNASGEEHQYSHALAFIADVSHGYGVAAGSRIALKAYEIAGIDTPIKFDELISLQEYLGIKANSKDLGLTYQNTIDALLKGKEIGIERGRPTILHYLEYHHEARTPIDLEFAKKHVVDSLVYVKNNRK